MVSRRTPSAKDLKLQRLEKKVLDLQAQLVHVYHFASVRLSETRRSKMSGSAIIVRLDFLGGGEVCPPFALKDGLSDETIEALKDDLKYSFDRTTEFKP